jgi:glycosyltransferase 2 family protein
MRNFLFVILLFLGIALVILSFGEIETIVNTLQQGNLWFVLMMLLMQIAWFFVIGRMYRSIYHLLDMDDSTLNLSLVAAAANFINIVAPTAGMGGIALFAAEARRRGHPSGKATVAGALFLLFDQAAFLLILALGLIVLFRRNHLAAGEITASLLLFASACVFAFVLYQGYRSANRLGNALARMAHLVNKISKPLIHRAYLSEDRAHEFAREIADGFSGLPQRARSWMTPILFGLLNKSLLMAVLALAFLSFDVPFSAGTIVGGFSMGYLFLLVSPTPSGIGVVEGLMPLALSSLRVVWSQAVIITLIYRAFTFWIPLGVGAWAFRWLHGRNAKLVEPEVPKAQD